MNTRRTILQTRPRRLLSRLLVLILVLSPFQTLLAHAGFCPDPAPTAHSPPAHATDHAAYSGQDGVAYTHAGAAGDAAALTDGCPGERCASAHCAYSLPTSMHFLPAIASGGPHAVLAGPPAPETLPNLFFRPPRS